MKKFYENPFMAVERFDAENIVTASGPAQGERYEGETASLAGSYAVKTIDASIFNFTF